MAAPRKLIPENVGARIREMNALGDGSRKIAKAIAQEFGAKHNYSHQHIWNYLHAESPAYNVPLPAVQTDSFYPNQSAPTRSVAAWQVPDVYVPNVYVDAQTYPAGPSTVIVPYQYPQNPPAREDSIWQVMLDSIREKNKAAIWHAYDPPDVATSDSTSAAATSIYPSSATRSATFIHRPVEGNNRTLRQPTGAEKKRSNRASQAEQRSTRRNRSVTETGERSS